MDGKLTDVAVRKAKPSDKSRLALSATTSSRVVT